MQLTDFETSKKLKQLGFKADFEWCYSEEDENQDQAWSWDFEIQPWEQEREKEFIPTYDLETILEALPEEILDIKTCLNTESLVLTKDYICYDSELTTHSKFCIDANPEETLATTAARLLIKLIEENIINLKEKTND